MHTPLAYARGTVPTFSRSARTRTRSLGFGDQDVIQLHHTPLTRHTYPEGRNRTCLRRVVTIVLQTTADPFGFFGVGIRAEIIGATKNKERAAPQLKAG